MDALTETQLLILQNFNKRNEENQKGQTSDMVISIKLNKSILEIAEDFKTLEDKKLIKKELSTQTANFYTLTGLGIEERNKSSETS